MSGGYYQGPERDETDIVAQAEAMMTDGGVWRHFPEHLTLRDELFLVNYLVIEAIHDLQHRLETLETGAGEPWTEGIVRAYHQRMKALEDAK